LARLLAEKKGLEVEVQADAPCKVPQVLYFDFLRVGPEAARRYQEARGVK